MKRQVRDHGNGWLVCLRWMILPSVIGSLLVSYFVMILSGKSSSTDSAISDVKWRDFNEPQASTAMLASIELHWGITASGTRIPHASTKRSSHKRQINTKNLHLTFIGDVHWLPLLGGAGSRGNAWSQSSLTATADTPFEYRVLSCEQGTHALQDLNRSYISGSHVVVLGQCHSTRTSTPSRFSLFASLYDEVDAVHTNIGKLCAAYPDAIIVYSDSIAAPAISHISNTTSPRSWENRKSFWWGWNVLSGRAIGTQSLRAGMGGGLTPLDEYMQLRAYLFIRHICLNGVVVLFPQAPDDGVLQTMLRQIQYLKSHEKSKQLPAVYPLAPLDLTLHCAPFLLTRKALSACSPQPQLSLPVLLTTLGGGGTHFLARSLQKHGVQVLHEGVGPAGSVAWMYAVNDVMLNTLYPHHAFLSTRSLGILSPRFDEVIHVTRNPLAHISSFTAHLSSSYAFVQMVAQEVATALAMVLSMNMGGNAMKRKELVKLHALASIVGNHELPGSTCSRGDECNLQFAALSWLFWDAFVALQADRKVRIEDTTELSELTRQLCSKVPKIKCQTQSDQHEASLLLAGLSTVYKGINIALGKRTLQIKPSVHSHHKEYSLSHLLSMPPLALPVDGTLLNITAEVLERMAQHGYMLST